jgi:gliding motility-associated-like protein
MGVGLSVFGQNHIPNSSFEVLDSCASDQNQLALAEPWQNPINSADVFHTCVGDSCPLTLPWVCVPHNGRGYEWPHSGEGYAGILTGGGTVYREFVSVPLVCPLQPGAPYVLSFFLSLADVADRAIDGIGAHFSAAPVNSVSVLNALPQFETADGWFITQKNGWVLVSDTFNAIGNERYLTIGNFRHDTLTDFVAGLGGYANFSYYFIDDVEVVPIGAPPPPIYRAMLGSDTLLCLGDTLVLEAAASVSNYLWQDGSVQPHFSVTGPGLYWVQRYHNCIIEADSIRIDYDSTFYIDLGKDTVLCPGQTMTLHASAPNASYLWQDGSIGSTYSVVQEGVYWVEVRDRCTRRTDTLSVDFTEPPGLDFLGADTTFCPGDSLWLNAANPYSTYRWQDGSTDSLFLVIAPGLYSVELYDGCTFFEDSIRILPLCEVILEMPNVFSPNGDGRNDRYLPVEIQGVRELAFSVFNRWGAEVFSSAAEQLFWDGNMGGRWCSEGVYFWRARAVDYPGQEYLKTGTVTLVR